MTAEVAIAKVTTRGRATIPAKFRRSHNIGEGGKVIFSRSKTGEFTLAPLSGLAELAGVDSKKVSYNDAVRRLDRLRSNDR